MQALCASSSKMGNIRTKALNAKIKLVKVCNLFMFFLLRRFFLGGGLFTFMSRRSALGRRPDGIVYFTSSQSLESHYCCRGLVIHIDLGTALQIVYLRCR